MFTGIIEELGVVKGLAVRGPSGQITIQAKKVLEGTRTGDSIAVNGICLTVVSMDRDSFTADVMAETFRRSSLGACQPGIWSGPWQQTEGSAATLCPATLTEPG